MLTPFEVDTPNVTPRQQYHSISPAPPPYMKVTLPFQLSEQIDLIL